MITISNPQDSQVIKIPQVTLDVLPEDQVYWEKIHNVLKDLADAYGFNRLELPIAEREDFFTKKLKGYADNCENKIYTLQDSNGSRLSLRPDFVPSMVRAYLENNLMNLPIPVRLHTTGAVFYGPNDKHKLFNQGYQASFEIIGEKDPVIDVQLIQLFFSMGRDLKIKNLVTQINSIGCSRCRPNYRKVLINFYKGRDRTLCLECRKWLLQNPIKLLNCHENKCAKLIVAAPQMIDYLCNDCHGHFRSILEFLDEVGIPYILNPYLFKNTDYYNKTVFEISVEGAQNDLVPLAIGYRHDDLISALGGETAPAAGMDVRIDRIIDLMRTSNIKVNQRLRPLIFLVQLGDLGKKKSLTLFEQLRRAGLRVASSVSYNTMTSQLKAANELGARFILNLRKKEALDETIIIRDVFSGIQELIPLNKTAREIKKRLKEK